MGQNSIVWKDKARITMFTVKGSDKNSNVCKNRARIQMFGRMGWKFKSVKYRARIPKCRWIR